MSKIKDAVRIMQLSRESTETAQTTVQEGTEVPENESATQVESSVNANTLPASTAPRRLNVEKETVPANPDAVFVDIEQLRDAGMLAPPGQERTVAEQFRFIKRPLLTNAAGKGMHAEEDQNLLMISSALPGEGKSFSSINLSLSIAQERDTSVILVDADIAKPHISNLFGVADSQGLSDIVADPRLSLEEVLLQTSIPGLWLLPAGTRQEQTTELLASRRMASLAKTLALSFPDKIVIFDAPPLLVTNEARVIAGLVGQVVIVVGSGKTLKHDVKRILGYIDESKSTTLILNRAATGIGESHVGFYGYGL